MIDVFIGYDEGEKVAFHILAESIRRNSSQPVSITPLCLSNIPEFTREKQDNQSTDFAFSRFMVPSLRKYEGFSIFMDCDMMLRTDIFQVLNDLNPKNAISVVMHDYTPSDTVKYLNNVQYAYPRKNWSSFVAWNCAHPKNRTLTPESV